MQPDKSESYNANSANIQLIPILENENEEQKDIGSGRERPIFNPNQTIENDDQRPISELVKEHMEDDEARKSNQWKKW